MGPPLVHARLSGVLPNEVWGLVVIELPLLDHHFGFRPAGEPFSVQPFIPRDTPVTEARMAMA